MKKPEVSSKRLAAIAAKAMRVPVRKLKAWEIRALAASVLTQREKR